MKRAARAAGVVLALPTPCPTTLPTASPHFICKTPLFFSATSAPDPALEEVWEGWKSLLFPIPTGASCSTAALPIPPTQSTANSPSLGTWHPAGSLCKRMSREGRVTSRSPWSKFCLLAGDNSASELQPRAALGLEAKQKSPAEQEQRLLSQDKAVCT